MSANEPGSAPIVVLTNLSPDSYCGTVAETDPKSPYKERTVIYKANDILHVGPANNLKNGGFYFDGVPAGKNLTIQAMEVVLIGAITIPRGDVQIYCRKLSTLSDVPTTIDVSATKSDATDKNTLQPKVIDTAALIPIPGANGIDIAESWRRGESKYGALKPTYSFGEKGEAGGTITIICDEINLQSKLTLLASGRNGYTGCSGQNGGPNFNPDQPGGRGGDAQAGGDGGDGGSIFLQYKSDQISTVDSMLVWKADAGPCGAPGAAGKGFRGAGDGNAANTSFDGNDGKTAKLQLTDLSILGDVFDEVFLLKAALAAKLYYLLNQPTAFNVPIKPDSSGTMAILKDKLGWLQSCIGHYKADYYTKDQAPVSGTVSRKRNVFQMVNTYYLRATSSPPVTAFNNVASAIPGWNILQIDVQQDHNTVLRAIENAYLFGGDGTLDQLAELRVRYETAFNKLVIASSLEAALQESTKDFADAAAYYEGQYKSLCEFLDPNKANGLSAQLTAASVKLSVTIIKLRDTLKKVDDTLTNHFNCNLKNILASLPTLLFVLDNPAALALMGGAIAAGHIAEGFSQINDNSGNAIDKGNIIKNVKVLELDKDQSFASAVRGELFESDGSGGVRLKSNVTTILAQLSTLEDQLSDVSDSINADSPGEMEAVTAVIEEFKTVILERSALQIEFMRYAGAMASAWQNWKEAERQVDSIAKKPGALAPTMAGAASYLAMLYQESLTNFVAFASDFKRHVAWLTLNNSNSPEATQIATKLSSAWNLGTFPGKSDLESIRADLERDCNTLTNYFLNVAGAASDTPADKTRRPDDLMVIIDNPLLLKKIQSGIAANGSSQPLQIMIVPEGAAITLARSDLSVLLVMMSGSLESLDLQATNNSFVLAVNGVSSNKITLAKMQYASNAKLAAALESAINSDAALAAAAISVSVSYSVAERKLCLAVKASKGISIASASDDLSEKIGIKKSLRGVGNLLLKVRSLDLSNADTSFKVIVNGIPSGDLSVTPQAYTTGSELALSMENVINGDPALSEAGQFVSVNFDSSAKQLSLGANRSLKPSIVVTASDEALSHAIGLGLKPGASQFQYFYQTAGGGAAVALVECSASKKFWDIRVDTIQPRLIGATYTGTYYPATSIPQSSSDKRPQAISLKVKAHPTRLFWPERTSSKPDVNHLAFTHPAPRVAHFEHYWVTNEQDIFNDDIAGTTGSLVDGGLSPLGLFGIWTLALDEWSHAKDANANIDFSTVSKIQLGFTGKMRSIL